MYRRETTHPGWIPSSFPMWTEKDAILDALNILFEEIIEGQQSVPIDS